MDCHDVKSVCTQGLESWGDLGFEHRDVTSDDSIFVATDERRPGVESHACVYGRSHFLNCEVVAAQRDLIDRASLLAFVSDDFRDCSRVEAALGGGAQGGCRMPDQVQRRLYLSGQVDCFAVSVNMHKENPWLFPKEMVVQCGNFQSVL